MFRCIGMDFLSTYELVFFILYGRVGLWFAGYGIWMVWNAIYLMIQLPNQKIGIIENIIFCHIYNASLRRKNDAITAAHTKTKRSQIDFIPRESIPW